MCYIWEGKIERCEQCSETDFQTLRRVIWNTDPARQPHQLIARTAQHPLSNSYLQSSIHNARVNGAAQHGQQEKYAVQACSSKQGAQSARTAERGQQVKDHDTSSSSKHNARSDWAWARGRGAGRKESHQDRPSSSRHQPITDPTGEAEQEASQKPSQNHPRIEDMEVLTAGMNKLPPPCWGDERVILPLVQEQLRQENFLKRQEQEMDEIWGPYEKEKQALAAFHAPKLAGSWTPVFEDEEIVGRDIPLVEEMWARSVLAGEDSMRRILDEDKTWPHEPSDDPNIWTREEGGMLSSANLKRLLRVLTLEESMKEEGLQISDENNTVPTTWRIEEGDEVTQSFGEVFTSAAYPQLASQAQD